MFRRVLQNGPASAEAHHNLASALFADGQLAESVLHLDAALRLRPSFEAALVKLAAAHEQLGREADAVAAYRRLGRVTKDRAQKGLFKARALSLEGATQSAEAELRRVMAACPSSEGARVLLGQLLLEMGRFQEGEAYLVQSLDAFPDVFQQVAASRRLTERDGPLLERALAIAERADLSRLQKTAIHFGLGKGFDDIGDYAEAMRHYELANDLRAKSSRLDRSGLTAHYDRTIANYKDATAIKAAQTGGSEALDVDTPVFILGMPRSGTTLIEQVLTSHPSIAAGGELSFWRDFLVAWQDREKANGAELLNASQAAPVRNLLTARPAVSSAEKAGQAALAKTETIKRSMAGPELMAAAEDYAAVLRRIGPTALRVTDKAPFNFERIGMILAALPKARIIHCRREPVDTCLSIFFTNYKGRQAWTKGDLVFQYRQYQRLMNHWRSILPAEQFIEVDYDAVVANRDQEARRLISFCGLEWDDACLAPEQNKRVVKSASLWQARQPIYTRSLERWRKYEPWLGELRELLDADVA